MTAFAGLLIEERLRSSWVEQLQSEALLFISLKLPFTLRLARMDDYYSVYCVTFNCLMFKYHIAVYCPLAT